MISNLPAYGQESSVACKRPGFHLWPTGTEVRFPWVSARFIGPPTRPEGLCLRLHMSMRCETLWDGSYEFCEWRREWLGITHRPQLANANICRLCACRIPRAMLCVTSLQVHWVLGIQFSCHSRDPSAGGDVCPIEFYHWWQRVYSRTRSIIMHIKMCGREKWPGKVTIFSFRIHHSKGCE